MAARYSNNRKASELSDCELLTVFLSNNAKCTKLTHAENIIRESGTLTNAVYKSNYADQSARLTLSQISKIQAGMEIGRRIAYENISTDTLLDSPTKTREFLTLHLADRVHECFTVIAMCNRHRIIECRDLSYGDGTSASVYPRVVLEFALEVGAQALILVHNHPSKISADPSDSDVRLTSKICDAAKTIDLRILDHLIIAGGQMTSLAERGLM